VGGYGQAVRLFIQQTTKLKAEEEEGGQYIFEKVRTL
jgi:hypothetical protein